tara:strand:+ start:61 stop:1143 length:1083 start_codon:yes stop_codon:yes gene_type:complete
MIKGSLTYEDYCDLIKKNIIKSNSFNFSQIQPSSIDLTLSKECYEIKASFLSPNNKIKDILDKTKIKEVNLENSFVFKKNKIYLVKLNEKLNLSKNIFGKCNPKSSTGRLDIFCRTVLDYCDEYEKIPFNYSGNIYLEITTRSFNIEFKEGDSLNQMRLIYNDHKYINDLKLNKINLENPIIFDKSKINKKKISSGLKISVDLDKKNKVSCYVSKKNTPILKFSSFRSHKINDYWKKLNSSKGVLLIEPGKFYILKSKEKIRIPNNMAGEMIPYDTGIGDFRVHYAGFFDPGFGEPNGTYAVLEVKTHEVPFILQDGQVIARIRYEFLNKNSKVVYGSNIKSNYQNQGLALSKHFEKITL